MRFALYRAVARCQVRRLSAAATNAPLPAVIIVALVVVAPFALVGVGRSLGTELAIAATSREVATALVLGPCLAAAAGGGVVAASLPPRSALGGQVAAGPCDARSVVAAGLLLPAALVTVVVAPSLVSLALAVADPFPGGRPSGLALVAATLSAVPVGALAVEGALVASRGARLRLLPLGLGLAAWVLVGGVAGAIPFGPLGPAVLAVTGSGSAWVALVVSGVTTIVLTGVWVALAAERRESLSRAGRGRHLGALWRHPLVAGSGALVWRRSDVRRGAGASACFGLIGAAAALAADAASPAPFLLATTTTLLGSLVGSLAGWGGLVPGLWLWRGAPQGGLAVGATTWLAGLVSVAIPVALVGAVATACSGVDGQTVGVVTVLVVSGAAVATFAGALVPWRRDGLGEQVSSLSAFAAVAVGTSLGVGLVAPRLAAAGVPDPATAGVLCCLLSGAAVATLAFRLDWGGR